MKIYRTIILPVVLYGCETWSLKLREERRLRVFENKVFRRTLHCSEEPLTVISIFPKRKTDVSCSVFVYADFG